MEDSHVQGLKKKLLSGEVKEGFKIVDGRVLYKGRYVIPSKSTTIPILLREYHDSAIGEHGGDVKTYIRMAQEWFWPDMRKLVAEYVKHCEIFQRNKASHQRSVGLIQPLPIPIRIQSWLWLIDFLSMPTSLDCATHSRQWWLMFLSEKLSPSLVSPLLLCLTVT